jgi:hypothetical protein
VIATERLGRATGQVEASGQKSAVGAGCDLAGRTRVKSWMPTRLLTGEGRADREETDAHLFCGCPLATVSLNELHKNRIGSIGALLSLSADSLRAVLAVKGSLAPLRLTGAPLTAPGRSEDRRPRSHNNQRGGSIKPSIRGT